MTDVSPPTASTRALASAHEALDRKWDAIVVGTGMAGATMGYALARAGLRVLFCEKGRSHLGAADVLRGEYPELLFPRPAVPGPQHRDLLLRAGRWTDPLEDGSQVRSRSFVPFLGAGTGGSSALYGMALERFAPSDFVPREHHPDAREALLPERWPISYADLAPYYAQAERLYRVRGTPDPLRRDADGQLPAPPALTGAGRALFDFLAGNGLHPYRLPLACEFVSGCNGCQGYLCGRNCKNDGGRICIEPALREHGASLLDECDVVRLEASSDRVTGIVCVRRGETFTLRGDIVVLAAGALATPRLLLDSASPQWPTGLANGSGMVGRNLMRHHVDLFAVFTGTAPDVAANAKELAFNDFYAKDARKLGTVQSFGHCRRRRYCSRR